MEHPSLDDVLAAETRHIQGLHRLLATEIDAVTHRRTMAMSARTGGFERCMGILLPHSRRGRRRVKRLV